MKCLLLFCLCFISCLAGLAQHNLSGGIRTSALTYVYRLSSKEAGTLHRNHLKAVADSYLHTLTDSFFTGKKVPALAAGNYLFLSATGNRLMYRLHTSGNINAHLLSNDRELFVALKSDQGDAVENAIVRLKKKKLAFNKALQSYGPVSRRTASEINVIHENVFYKFPVDESAPVTRRRINSPYRFFQKFLHPRRYGYTNRHYARRPASYENKFSSFMVLNKPTLRRGDTVRIKSFVQSRKGRPVDRRLLLRLSDDSFDKDTILAVLSPYRPGGFEYQFVLSKSLDLDLDENYTLTLEEESSRKFDLNSYDGDDEEAYLAKRKVLARGRFEFEEYELKAINFTARAAEEEHSRGEDLSIFLQATNENDLPVFDGRVQILVLPAASSQTNYHEQKVFLADTLWRYTQTLENIGESKVLIPDSVFPRADFNYRIECLFLNSNNESQTKTLYQKFRDEENTILFTPKNDSLNIRYKVKGNTVLTEAEILAFHKEDTIGRQKSLLPASVKINFNADVLKVNAGEKTRSLTLSDLSGKITCLSNRTKDSITIQLVNPQRLAVWYTVFAGKKIVLRGSGDSLLYSAKSLTRRNYFVSFQYLAGGKLFKEEFTIPFREKLLTITTDQPVAVYPGQTAAINFQVTNASGEPVADADLTAYSLTKKFKQPAPSIPYLGKKYALRKSLAPYHVEQNDEPTSNLLLNWNRWSREMNLDTVEYYKFLHPEKIYLNREPVPDSVTQLAPFVVVKGELQPIHLLYIDEKPVFFSQAGQLQRYSFQVTAGSHKVRIRTRNHSVTLDSVNIARGMKTLLSIDAESSDLKQKIEVVPTTLSKYEQSLISRYMILVEDNYRQSPVHIRQGSQIFQLHKPGAYGQSKTLVGPLSSFSAEMIVRNQFRQSFEPEGGWLFSIRPGLVKQKQYPGIMQFPKQLSANVPAYDFHDLVLTESELDSAWQNFLDDRANREDLFRNAKLNRYGNGRLQIGFPQSKPDSAIFIRSLLLFRYDDPDFMRVYSGMSTDLGFLEPGSYRLLFLLKGNRYILQDSVAVKAGGMNYFEVSIEKILEPDTVSERISRIVETAANAGAMSAFQINELKDAFQGTYLDPSSFTNTATGILLDAKKKPIAYASVQLAGTRFAAVTNADGRFIIRTPLRGRLIFSAVGYESKEVAIKFNTEYRVALQESSNNLSEVVVTGYGTQTKRSLTGSATVVQQLSGKIPGLLVRGSASDVVSVKPMIIVDGLPYVGTLESIDPAVILNTSILKGESAVAIYGEAAASGVIFITTKKADTAVGTNQPGSGNSLRNHFSDEAYWQPKLRTDRQGRASLRVTFPDDVTSWQTFAIATAKKKFTGFSEGLIKSFRVISGSISLPQFALDNDSMQIIGKTLNYTTDSIQVKRSFFVNNIIQQENILDLRNSVIDTFNVTPQAADSIKFKYLVEKSDGYMDGEEKSIPVYKQGVLETKGMFAALRKDTIFTILPGSDSARISIYASSSPLPALYAEAESIRTYEYLCNEQLASKLKALLAEKKIDGILRKPFTKEKYIREIISQLNKSKNAVNMWGWWPNSESNAWISLHAIEALMEAQKAGYPSAINKTALTDYLVFNIESYKDNELLSALSLLRQIGAGVNFAGYIDSAEKKIQYRSLALRLRLAELKQSLKIPIDLAGLLARRQQTVFGNIYWGEEGIDMFDNSIQITLSMYRLLRSAGDHEDLLEKMRGYFLESKKTGKWRNTYESSLILETILPDLINQNKELSNANLSIDGAEKITVSSFPFSREINAGNALTVRKQGNMPVYFSAYQQSWNKAPVKQDGNFIVSSHFKRNEQRLNNLKAGEAVTLQIEVKVVANAEYVMIEIPIPAGCSYQDKPQSFLNNEVHREYFKHKVNIFCKALEKGIYNFEVSLLPRYTGSYTLNPAKAEMMYFPVFSGREAMKKIIIK